MWRRTSSEAAGTQLHWHQLRHNRCIVSVMASVQSQSGMPGPRCAGAVWRCTDKETGAVVAVKKMKEPPKTKSVSARGFLTHEG